MSEDEPATGTADGVSTGSVSRRGYLKTAAGLAAVSAAGTGAFVGTARAGHARHGIQFENVVDMGATDADPSGVEPSDDAIEAAAAPNTLLAFPPGDYLVEDRHEFSGLGSFGFYGDGSRHSVSFVAPDGLRGDWFRFVDLDAAVWENVDWDATGDDQLGNLTFLVRDRLHIEDVELVGDTTAVIGPDEFEAPDATYLTTNQGKMMKPYVLDPDGHGLVKNVVAKTGGGISSEIAKKDPETGYRQGRRGGFFVGPDHEGTLTFADCHIEEFGSHGIYGSAAAGAIHVEGGVWRNNDNSQIRIGGEDSYVKNAFIEIDTDSIPDSSPTEVEGGYRGIKGIWWQPKKASSTGGLVKNCRFNYLSHPENVITGKGQPKPPNPRECITVQEDGPGRFADYAIEVKNVLFRVDVDEAKALEAFTPEDVDGVAPEKFQVRLKNVRVTGEAGEESAVLLRDRPGSHIKNTSVEQSGANRDGLTFVRSDATLKNVAIDVTGDPLVTEDCELTTKNVWTN